MLLVSLHAAEPAKHSADPSLTGKEVFQPFAEALAPLYQSQQWQSRHAALSAIASVGEGCADSIVDQLPYFVKSVPLCSTVRSKD